MKAPKVGDRVRVTEVIEGVVERVESGADHGDRLLIRKDHLGLQRMVYGWVNYGDPEQTIEVLPPPEPDWQDGDIVIDRIGITHLRTDDIPNMPWRTFNGQYHDDTFPLRPLVLAARDGKPVTP